MRVAATVMRFSKGTSPTTDKPVITVAFQLEQPIVLDNGNDIPVVFASFVNADGSEPLYWRLAEFRYAVDLGPFYLASEKLQVPVLVEGEQRRVLNKPVFLELGMTERSNLPSTVLWPKIQHILRREVKEDTNVS